MPSTGIQTIFGRISHVGQFTYDNVVHNYSTIEVETSAGRVDLSNVMASNALDRAIEPGRDVAMAVVHGNGNKAQAVVLGVFDVGAQRTFSDEQMSSLRSHAVKQALLLRSRPSSGFRSPSCFSSSRASSGFGCCGSHGLAVSKLPTAEDVQRVIAALPSQGAQLAPAPEAH